MSTHPPHSHVILHRARRWTPALGLLAALAPGVAAAASIGLGRPTGFTAAFSTRHVASASGLVLRTTGRPPAAGVQVPAAVRQTVVLPRGTSLRLGALPQCHASEVAIAAQGAEGACPASSRVGTGRADGILGGKPVHFDIGIYAVRGHLIFAAEQNGKPLKQAFPGVAHGSSLQLTVPTLNGSIAPTGFKARIPAGHSATPWLRTPPSCPASRRWIATGHFQGLSAAAPPSHPVTPLQTLTAKLPCHP
jgi:hypothetical protein